MAEENIKNSEQTTTSALDAANKADKVEDNSTCQANSETTSKENKQAESGSANAQDTTTESKQSVKNEPTCRVYTSDEAASHKEAAHVSLFWARLLFILASLLALPFYLFFMALGISFTIATLAIFFGGFVIAFMIFYPNLWHFLASRLAFKPVIDAETFPYFCPYIEAMPTEYRFIIASILLFLIALLILAIAFGVLKLAKAIWHGLGKWRNKLSR